MDLKKQLEAAPWVKWIKRCTIFFLITHGLFIHELRAHGCISDALYGVSKVYLLKKNIIRTKMIAFRQVDLSREYKRYDGTAQEQIISGNINLELRDYPKAIWCFKKVMALQDSVADLKIVIDSYEGLFNSLLKNNNKREAFAVQSKLKELQDTLNARNQIEKLNELRLKFEASQAMEDLRMQQEKKAGEWMLLGLVLVFSPLVFVSLIMVMAIKIARLKKEIKTNEEIKGRIDGELILRKSNESKLLLRILHKNKELTTTSLSIIQKKELIDSVMKQIDSIKREAKINSEVFDNLFCRSIENVEKDWEKFKLYFDQVHEGFFRNLKSGSPNLTENDLKWVALLRLNLDSRHIASILNVSSDSVKVIRHRLRKKLNVPEEKNLFDFLNNFETQKILKVA